VPAGVAISRAMESRVEIAHRSDASICSRWPRRWSPRSMLASLRSTISVTRSSASPSTLVVHLLHGRLQFPNRGTGGHQPPLRKHRIVDRVQIDLGRRGSLLQPPVDEHRDSPVPEGHVREGRADRPAPSSSRSKSSSLSLATSSRRRSRSAAFDLLIDLCIGRSYPHAATRWQNRRIE
jgi:hypothetical protein